MTFETEREIQIHVANHMIGEWDAALLLCVYLSVWQETVIVVFSAFNSATFLN